MAHHNDFDVPSPDELSGNMPGGIFCAEGMDEWYAARDAGITQTDTDWADTQERRELIRRAIVRQNRIASLPVRKPGGVIRELDHRPVSRGDAISSKNGRASAMPSQSHD